MNQSEIAKTVGIGMSYLTMILSGMRKAGQKLIDKLSSLRVYRDVGPGSLEGRAFPDLNDLGNRVSMRPPPWGRVLQLRAA